MPCPSAPSPTSSARTEPLSINHQGQFPAITVSFNLAPNASLGERDRRHQQECRKTCTCRPACRPTSRAPPRLSSNSLSNEAAADPRRPGHGLHRARRSVRELHSSHHDSFHAAFGRRRRVSRADPLPPGPERRRHHRHRPADRHREEERHHDGRLRARSRARARQECDRCDLRGLPAALPSHHDDHDGRAAGRRAAGVRLRASARSCAGRWASPWSAVCC